MTIAPMQDAQGRVDSATVERPAGPVDADPGRAGGETPRPGVRRAWWGGSAGSAPGGSRARELEEGRLDVAAIRERAQHATPGPWVRHGAGIRGGPRGALLFAGRDGSPEIRHQADLDAEFVVHAREDVLALLDALDNALIATAASSPKPEPRAGRIRWRRLSA